MFSILALMVAAVIPLMIFIAIIIIVLKLVDKNKRSNYESNEINDNKKVMPYDKRDTVLTKDEINLYIALEGYLGKEIIICPKMNMKDFLRVKDMTGKSFNNYYMRLIHYNPDFMLFEKVGFKPICGILLYDSRKSSAKINEVHSKLKSIFDASNIDLVKINRQDSYTIELLEEALRNPLDRTGLNIKNASAIDEDLSCPKCGGKMVKRISQRGDKKGSEFYGCANYPSCKGIINI